MGFEENRDVKMLGMRLFSRHKRSKSFPDKRRVEVGCDDSLEESPSLKLDTGGSKGSLKTMKQQSLRADTHNSLKEEILQLEKRLQEQFALRHALEKALSSKPSSYETNEPSTVPKLATDLIKEIAVLELEVGYLEQYLLALYRKAFDQKILLASPTTKDPQISSASPTPKDQKISSVSSAVKNQRFKSPGVVPRRLFRDEDSAETMTNSETSTATNSETFTAQPAPMSLSGSKKEPVEQSTGSKILDSTVHRCHSALSHRTTLATRPSPDSLSQDLRACHSQPLSMTEFAASNVISLAGHFGTRISDHIPETPNRISEDMVKCMAAIFRKLGEPPSANNGLSSPNSSSSSSFSQYHCDEWSPGSGKDPSFDACLDNPFNVEGLKEFNGPYSTMVEVSCIYRESQTLGEVEHMLQSFRSLICQLQEVDPRKMNHEEKLAFWINVHNALVMHAFLAYGVPKNNVKRVFLLLKAAYSVGGHTISADTIQSYILGCRMSRPGQWLRMFFSQKSKFKTGDDRQAYAIEHPEPLLHFALCSGSHSDPALRVYTPNSILQELETAKDDYIRATFGIRKDQRIVLLKLVESYAKDSCLCPAAIVEMIQQSLPDSLGKSLKKYQSGKSRRSIEWMSHNFAFRYLISRGLVK